MLGVDPLDKLSWDQSCVPPFSVQEASCVSHRKHAVFSSDPVRPPSVCVALTEVPTVIHLFTG